MMHAQVNRIGKKVVAMQISAFVSVMRKGARAHTIYFRHMFSPSSTAKRVCFIIMRKNTASVLVLKVVAALRSS